MATDVQRCLSIDDINPRIKAMEYMILGPLVIRASEIEKELEQGVKKPFTEIIKASLGDCHAMGQVPITFMRQILALVSYPKLLEDPSFPDDAKSRARELLKACGGSVGSYTESAGIAIIRKHVAEYIQKRDGGIPCDWQNIILTGGASEGIKNVLKMLNCEINGKKPGVMVPVPQYPIYSTSITEFDMYKISYYLDEKNNWGLNLSELERSIDEAKMNNCLPRVIVVINPGNPTGQVLSRENIEEIIKFAHKNRLFIFADEVYQDNVYAEGSKFHSFKKVLMEMGAPYNKMELASFLSCSKGCYGECGLRGGYVEVTNMCPKVKAMFMKSIITMLCPTVLGQVAIDVVVNPPQAGEPSYETFMKERSGILNSLKERAQMVADAFNSFEGFSCTPVQGALYAFPQFKLPPKAIEAAKAADQEPDYFYAYQLLEDTGICIVPGSGFGQQPGTFHFRTTILPQTPLLKAMLEKFRTFHENFYKKYA